MIVLFFILGLVASVIFIVALFIAAVCYIGGKYNQIDAQMRGLKK